MIGRLDEQIALERRVKVPDGGGGEEVSFAAFAEDPAPWARVALKGGGEGDASGRPVARQRAEFTIRARADLTERDRLLWDGRAWDIVSIDRPGARVKYMTILAVSGGIS